MEQDIDSKKRTLAHMAIAEGLILDYDLLNKDLSAYTPEQIILLAKSLPRGILTAEAFEQWQNKTPAIVAPTALYPSIKIVQSYEELPRKRDVHDFVKTFTSRFSTLHSILRSRQDLQGTLSINKLYQRSRHHASKEPISFIAMVMKKQVTKNNRIILTLEDPTGEITAIIPPENPLYADAKEVYEDEVLGFIGVMSNSGAVYLKAIIWPDVPHQKELKRSSEEEYALFVSDLHIGSKQFLAQDFERFLKWINGEVGTEEHKEILPKIKYLFIIGDLVDGVGVYPSQEDELEIKDIREQYKHAAHLLQHIPAHITIILCPGNHDYVRLAEPQPALGRDLALPLYDLPNIVMVSNPAYVTIGATNSFSGFDVLMYHGFSFDYYISNVDSIRTQGGYDRADLVMKYLLKRRHLAPTYGSTQIIPDEKDYLVINKVPDFFITGHIHKSTVAQYRGITLICGSCFQGITAFQIKVGHHPEPGRVPLVNLKTRDIKVLRF